MVVALACAARVEGRCAPNPAVGAAVFRGSQILGRGATRPPGSAHAEIVALRQAKRRAGARALVGAELAVTLEPCGHRGRTGPCSEAIIEAGIRRVWVALRDPHPLVNGRGLRQLRKAGIEVRLGTAAAAAREQQRGYRNRLEYGRPWVRLKLATSLDGRIATAGGESRWITGEAARARAHALRDRCDAILVGAGTALQDDPALSVRRGNRVLRWPIRVVADSTLRVPATRGLYQPGEEGEPAWVLHLPTAAKARQARLRRQGVRLFAVREAADGRVNLQVGLRQLAKAGVNSLLVEGGGELAAGLLRRDLVDEIHWFNAATVLGAEGIPAVGALGLRSLAQRPVFSWQAARQVGEDLYCVALRTSKKGK